ncbi:hypothetical protein SAMN05428987_3093 [Paenibacillus sp. CF095]|uniref:DUF6338 family protein n=1 Tax=Paenibacillus sp. CF095 TaxID=1881033 RepID=UPI0008823798|nr:DUF6338 family protein [Paenibacillus sp. CF095]SDC86550.1 hypothetical protein SAMN05428987_3093 [Paenibacillus sp. CF095]
MIFNNFEAVYFTVLMMVPGFIMNMGYNYILPTREGQAPIYLVRFIVFSCVNFALAWPGLNSLIKSRYWEEHPFRWSVLLVLIVLFLPYAIGLIAGIVTERKWVRKLLLKTGINPIHPSPTAWDYIMSNESRYVIVTLKNGFVIYGLFASKSLASTVPTEKDIYLEEIFELDDDETWVPKSKGIWISGSEILHIEFLIFKENQEGQSEESEPTE